MPKTMKQLAGSPSNRGDCSTREAAELLGMAVRSVQLMVDRGDLKAWKTPGGHRRIDRASVMHWMHLDSVQDTASAVATDHRPLSAVQSDDSPSKNAVQSALATSPVQAMLIEDSAHYQRLVRMLVEQHAPSVELHVADDGIAGLMMAGRIEPRILIVDILLPGIDGAALITSLRSNPEFSHKSLIVITSLDEAEREPYAHALAGLPVVHKAELVLKLPLLLAHALAALGESV